MATPTWSRADLERRLGDSLEVARRSIPILAAALPGEPAALPTFKREKFICETALLLYAASGAARRRPALRARIAGVASDLAPHARSEALITAMRLRPVVAPEFSVAHVCLTRLGFPDLSFQAELDFVLAASVTGMVERAPWKDVEADWLAGVSGRATRNDVGPVLARMTVTLGLDALSARREEIYAFTHGLIYLTDFGQRPRPLARPHADLVADADVALARCIDDDDFDLAAEVLMTWPYLRAEWTAGAAFGMSVLARVEDQVGLLPSLSLRQVEFAALEGLERKRYVATEAYHTAYVMGLLSAALLLPGCAPPSAVPSGAGSGAARLLHALMLPRSPIPQWEVDFASLSPRQQDRLAPFLAAVGLRRAVMQSDLERLRSILAASVDHHLPISPAIYQGAELLRRFARADMRASA